MDNVSYLKRNNDTIYSMNMKTKGFTLIELLVVISIVSLISSIVLSSINSTREKGRIAAGQQFSSSMHHAIGDELIGEWKFENDIATEAVDTSGWSFVSRWCCRG